MDFDDEELDLLIDGLAFVIADAMDKNGWSYDDQRAKRAARLRSKLKSMLNVSNVNE